MGVRTHWLAIGLVVALSALLAGRCNRQKSGEEEIWSAVALVRNFEVKVDTVGELEAAKSVTISSQVRGDVGKIVEIIPDGAQVEPGQVLVKLDPTPFEERLKEIRIKLKEQTEQVRSLEQIHEWELQKAELEARAIGLEAESAQLELEKIQFGDGPIEKGRLLKKTEKAAEKLKDTEGFYEELQALESEGYLKPSEVRAAEKKKREEEEAFLEAKGDLDHYTRYSYPVQMKHSEGKVERSRIREDEALRTGKHKVAEALVKVQHVKSLLEDLALEERRVQWELDHSEIRAPSPGMVVVRLDPRSTERRKFRIGDVVYRNTPILELPNLEAMIVKTRVREVDLGKVAVGKGATVSVDAYPDVALQGRVVAIGVLAQTEGYRNGGEKVFEVQIALEGKDSRLRPGMTARVSVHCDTVTEGVTVPVSALFYDEERRPYCYRLSRAGYVKQALKVGANSHEWAHIREGVKKGDRVALVCP